MDDDDLDRLLNRAAPSTSSDRRSVCRVATDLAYEVAASSAVPVARRRHRIRAIIGLSIAILLTGGTAAIASPLLLPWLPWTPDSLVERDFTIASGEGASCVIATRVSPDAQTAGPDQTTRLEEARRFLADHDWSRVTAVSISDLPPYDVEMKRRQGVSDSLIVAMSISDQISTAFSDAGLLGEGVSLEQAAHCEPAAAE